VSWDPRYELEFWETYGKSDLPTRKKLSPVVSLILHALAGLALVIVPLVLPERALSPSSPMATFFVAPLRPPPAAPPPPSAPVERLQMRRSTRLPKVATATAERFMTPRPISDAPAAIGDIGTESTGVPGGIEGGVPGGVEGGVPGGVEGGLPGSPAPSPAPPALADPVRIAPGSREAVPIVKVDPIYPDMALRERVQGVVILDVVVNREGVPVNLRVVRSHAVFDAAAMEAVRKWRFSSYLVGGHPVPFKVLVTVQFQLTTKR